MNEQTGVITNYYKQLNSPNEDKNKVLKAFFQYILERKPEGREIMMLQKLIKDFDYQIVFEALVSLRYSSVDLSANYYGYLIAICKSLLKESITETQDDILSRKTEELLKNIKTKLKGS